MQKKLYELEREFKSDVQNGLTDEQIAENREQYGKNALEEKKKANLFVKFLMQFNDVLIIILLIAAVISVVIEPSEFVDSIIILVVVIINAILGVFQENKAEKKFRGTEKDVFSDQ